MSERTMEIWKDVLSRKSTGDRFDLATLERLCVGDGAYREVTELPAEEVLEVIHEMRRMQSVVVAALAWRGDRTTAGWLAQVVDEYRRLRREAGIEPAKGD